jgi:hypothetical protein
VAGKSSQTPANMAERYGTETVGPKWGDRLVSSG